MKKTYGILIGIALITILTILFVSYMYINLVKPFDDNNAAKWDRVEYLEDRLVPVDPYDTLSVSPSMIPVGHGWYGYIIYVFDVDTGIGDSCYIRYNFVKDRFNWYNCTLCNYTGNENIMEGDN